MNKSMALTHKVNLRQEHRTENKDTLRVAYFEQMVQWYEHVGEERPQAWAVEMTCPAPGLKR